MDPAPRTFDELPRDPELGLPVPFASGSAVYGARPDDDPPRLRSLDHRRVTQCALSRVCGVCGAALGRPLAFLGTGEEAARNAFHFPASHLACATTLAEALRGADVPVLGQREVVTEWLVVTSPAFEYVRPAKDDLDRRATFQPHHVVPLP